MKVLEVKWFSTMKGTVGVVKAKDETTGKIKFYMHIVEGQDEEQDTLAIMAWGCPVVAEDMEKFFEEGE